MVRGVRIAVDVGRARVGLARCDAEGLIATPLETVSREGALERISQLVSEYSAVELVVGLPLSLSGAETPSTADAREFALQLAELGLVRVRLVDERLSTVSAEGILRKAGKPAKKQRAVVDQVAAVIILQQLLDVERATGVAAGELVVRGRPS